MKPTTIIILLFLFLTGCSNNENTTTEAPSGNSNILTLTDEQLRSFSLSVTSLQEKTISKTLKLNGKMDVPPQHQVSVSAALGGYVKFTKLLPGMHFRKGELLATMEDNQYIQLQQDYLTAKTQLKNAEKEYQRQKELNQSKAISDKIFQKSEMELQTLQITVGALWEKLKLIHIDPEQLSASAIRSTANIYAPFDGYVARVNVNTGKYAAPSDILFELVNLQELHLNLKVFEKDWDKIKTDQQLLAYSNNDPENKYKGRIMLIGKVISEERALEVHAHLDSKSNSLIPGLYMNADIEVTGAKTQALPESCILSFEGKNYVFVRTDDHQFELMLVKTGNTGNGWIEIEDAGKLQNRKVVQAGAYTLLMALKNKAED